MSEPKRYDCDYVNGSDRIDMVERSFGDYYSTDDPAIVRDLAIASAAREAGMVDEAGRFRKIIGTLPVTADGCVIGLGGNCCVPHEGDILECGPIGIRDEDDGYGVIVTLRDVSGFEHYMEPEHLYSTRSAAEAAKGGGDAQG